MTSIYTCSTCMDICIFKNTLPSFLVAFVFVWLCVCMCTRALAACACGGNMLERRRQQCTCVSQHVTCVTQQCVWATPQWLKSCSYWLTTYFNLSPLCNMCMFDSFSLSIFIFVKMLLHHTIFVASLHPTAGVLQICNTLCFPLSKGGSRLGLVGATSTCMLILVFDRNVNWYNCFSEAGTAVYTSVKARERGLALFCIMLGRRWMGHWTLDWVTEMKERWNALPLSPLLSPARVCGHCCRYCAVCCRRSSKHQAGVLDWEIGCQQMEVVMLAIYMII